MGITKAFCELEKKYLKQLTRTHTRTQNYSVSHLGNSLATKDYCEIHFGNRTERNPLHTHTRTLQTQLAHTNTKKASQ